jgi:geranylgeranylglycerol-phosphate geranylgeranyltransferase
VAWIRLARLPNGLLAAAGVLVGARGAGAAWSTRVIAAALAAICLATVANAFNDYEDRDIDAVIHPDRPLPAGHLTPRTALRAVALAAVGGIALSAMARAVLGVVSVGVIILMLAYGRVKNRWGVAANAIVAVLGSLPFLYGAWSVGDPAAGALLVAVAAPLHFAREVTKDIDDVDGDRARRRTLPIVAGMGAAKGVAATAALIFCVAWLVLMRASWIAWPAAALAAFAAYRSAPRIYKAAMALAMIAYYVSPP